MHTLIATLLWVTAAYSGIMWLWLAGLSTIPRSRYNIETLIEFERQTFHLGLCFILCLGFLGLGAG